MKNLIKKYTSAFSVSGREHYLTDIIADDLKDFADEIKTDAMGNLIVFKKGKDSSKKLMLAAHCDEIGFVVTYIDDSGLIRVTAVGGISPVYSSYHKVIFENGVVGVLVLESELKTKDIANDKMIVDIGAKNKKEAEKKVSVGDYLHVAPEFIKLGRDRIAAKAFDDRIACAIIAQTARTCKTPAYDTYFAFTVQEEVGCRGSKTAAYEIAPDYAIAIDVTATGDTIGASPMACRLGDGAAVKIKDNSVLCSTLIINRLRELADKHKIKHQTEVLPFGGTDTSSMQTAGKGSAAGAISVPCRYVHSPVETVDYKDVEACEALIRAAVEEGIE